MKRLRFLLSALLIVGACAPSSDGPADPARYESVVVIEPERYFELSVGQRVRIGAGGPILTFRGVPSDSRCPEDVTCVWPGNAIVELELGGGSSGTRVHLHTDSEPSEVRIGSRVLALEQLQPRPKSEETPEARAYRVLLRLSNR